MESQQSGNTKDTKDTKDTKISEKYGAGYSGGPPL